MAEEEKQRPDFSEEDVIKRILAEELVDPVKVMAVMMRILVVRHLDCQRRSHAMRIAMGNERPNALTAVFDALHESRSRYEAMLKEIAPNGVDKLTDDESVSNEDWINGIIGAEQANLHRVLFRILLDSQRLAEHRESIEADGLDDEEEPWDEGEGPRMRLVTD